jgi:propanediol dehydratase large subunit
MALIKEIVQEALASGYLSIVAEDQMRSLMRSNYDSEDLDAWIILQRSVVAGDIKQESRRKKVSPSPKAKDASSSIKLAYQMAAEIAYAAAIALTMSKNTKDQPSLGA